MVTPSHHRVHHAINPEYIDKNYSQIFIFWDKLFGTFQPELPTVEPVYGITRPAQTWNPIKINFMHLSLLIRDAWRAQHWTDKVKIWFMPTGWRPADVNAKYPVYKINDVYHFTKFDTPASLGLHLWSWVQITVTLLLVSYLFGNIALIHQLHAWNIYLYGLMIFLSVYAYTDLMDRNRSALIVESIKAILGLTIIIQSGDWFGISRWWSGFPLLIGAYFIFSTLMTALLASKQPHTTVNPA
jgi:hypothetical protein